MNISDFRREYRAYYAALERERYKHHAGLEPRPHLEAIRDRYTDLRTLEAISDLRRVWDETPAHMETERAGLRALLGASRIAYKEERAVEVTEELKRCEEAARIM